MASVGCQLPQFARNLERQLSGGDQHQTLHAVHPGVQPFHQRDAEGRGLTRTGLRLAHHVFPSQHQRYNLGLNRCWQRVAHILHRTRHRNAQPQGPEVGVHLEGPLHGFRLVDLVVCAREQLRLPAGLQAYDDAGGAFSAVLQSRHRRARCARRHGLGQWAGGSLPKRVQQGLTMGGREGPGETVVWGDRNCRTN